MNTLCCIITGVNTALNDATDDVENRIMKIGDYLCDNGFWIPLWIVVAMGCVFMIGRMSA